MTAEDYQAAADVKNVKGERAPAGRALAVAEVQQLLATCGDDALGLRDAAVMAILYACGLRRAELVGLDLADYDGRELRIRRGKGNKERLAPVATNAAVYLDAWLKVRGWQPGPLFYGLGRNNDGGRLTTQTIYDLLQSRAAAAGIRPLSPHDFRRTFVSLLLDAGEDIVTVQRLAGHASVETTARYDRRGEDVKRRAVEKLSW
jgi:site-specific recombinase XerD